VRRLAAGLIASLVCAGAVAAGSVQVVDLAGRTVTVPVPVERFVISEGRYLSLLALLRPHDPVAGLVGTMSALGWSEPGLQARLFERFPAAAQVPRFGNTSADSVSVEQIIELQPQLAVFGLADHGPGAKHAELLRQLDAAGVAVVFIDLREDPLRNTVPSITLLGRVLGADAPAQRYARFYRERVQAVREGAADATHRPRVFVQVHPGRFECCWGMAEGMLGPFVGVAGGINIADAVAPGPTAQHTAEFLLSENPDVWIGTASGTAQEFRAGQPPVALGAGLSAQMAAQSLRRYLEALEFRALDAVRNGRAHAIWHGFYNSPFNVVVLEAFARWLHPQRFAHLDPQATLRHIYQSYLGVPLDGTWLSSSCDE
jgi:iron complex transport system substrate-binding protein